ncbi:MAG: hypothetical protein JWM34_3533 [Ilumatobacteraceae bacterium]|nr:hypothetical protein [Ilumatobacteraceae bacterium]
MSDWNNNTGPGVPPPPTPPPTGQVFLPPTQPVYQGSPGGPTYTPPGGPTLQPGPSPDPKRSRGKMVGALVGVLALVGAGTFAVTQISSNSSDGGASSAKDVGTKLVTALDGEDLLGVVDLLLPGERETLRQPMIDLASELTRLEVTDKSLDLNKVPGFDIAIANPKVAVDTTNADDISDVTVDGSATVTVNGKEIPIGKLLIDRVFNGDRPEVDSSPKDSDFHVKFAAVEKSGRWYLSLFYTAAETARGDRDIPKRGVVAAGADTPDGALDNLIKAGADFDLDGVIASLNPNEAEALQRYAPLFTDSAQKMLDKNEAKVSITDSEYTVTGTGDTRQVAPTKLTIKVSADGHDGELTLDGKCLTGNYDGTDVNTCGGDQATDSSLDGYLNDLGLNSSPEFKKFVDDLRTSFSDFSMHGIVVNKVGGKWYVSPVGSTLELVLSVLRALDRDEIDTLINDGRDAFNSVLSGVFTGDGGSTDGTDDTIFPDDTVFPDDTTATDDTVTPDTSTVDTSTVDTSTDDTVTDDTSTADTSTFDTSTGGSDDASYWFDCVYNGGTKDTAAACIKADIAKGSYTADDVPAPFLYPDCGLYDYYLGNDLYDDTAAKFHATIDPATSCIVADAAAAGVDLSIASEEFARPDCYANVNPYNFSEDSDAISQAYVCASSEP